jgi:hypothetical protein
VSEKNYSVYILVSSNKAMAQFPDYLSQANPRTEIDEDKIRLFDSEDDFNFLGVELFKEIAVLGAPIACSIHKDEDGNTIPFDMDTAPIVGNLVRYTKLSNALLEQFVQKRTETATIIFRCLAETFVNLKYFINYKDAHTTRHYIKKSLVLEKDLIEIIKRNVSDAGQSKAIEDRMIKSITKTFKISKFEFEQVNNSIKWDAKIKAKIKEILHPDFYVLIYGTASHAVHGNWQDLIIHHLDEYEDGFLPKANWTYPTLQMIESATAISCNLWHDYISNVQDHGDERDKLLAHIMDIRNRCKKLGEAHEEFKQSKP